MYTVRPMYAPYASDERWIVLTDHSDRFSAEFRAGALAYAREIGFRNVRLAGGAGMVAAVRAAGGARVGVVNHVRSAPVMAEIRRLGVPCILLGEDEAQRWGVSAASRVVACAVDHVAVGRMAAEYFLRQRRFASFLFVDTAAKPQWGWWAARRFAGFREGLCGRVAPESVGRFSLGEGAPDAVRAAFLARVRALASPAAVFCANDRIAHEVAQMCLSGGLYVPEEAAILGVDNAQEICEHAPVTLSSIAVDRAALGARAVAWMLGLLDGAARGESVLRGQPVRVVERNSTRLTAFGDRFVERAVRLIERRPDASLTAAQVADASGASRSYLERHFKTATGRTLHDFMEGELMREVCRRLATTDQSVAFISSTMGYSSSAYLCTKFRRRYGMTMQDYRSRVGGCFDSSKP